MCLDTVEGARPKSSTIWQAQSSPRLSAISIRTRFSSASALVIIMRSRIPMRSRTPCPSFRQLTNYSARDPPVKLGQGNRSFPPSGRVPRLPPRISHLPALGVGSGEDRKPPSELGATLRRLAASGATVTGKARRFCLDLRAYTPALQDGCLGCYESRG